MIKNRAGSRSRLAAFLVIAGALAYGGVAPREAVAQETPTRVILMIGDGAGAGYWTAAIYAANDLAVKQLPVGGLVDTRSSNSKITDSAAAATAYSAGIRTYNGALGVRPDSTVVPTVLELARDRGMATGLVATSSVTHATPAAFASHVPDREMMWEISRQMVDAEVDVVLGGGRAYFDPARRPDSLDLLGEIRADHTYVETADELAALNTAGVDRLFGLFTEEHLPAAPTRSPTLPAMTRAALEVLDHDPDGFFLMVEGSQPDWRGHDNAPMDAVVAEMLDFDQAIGVALDYQSRHPETLIVVTADHETGGLAIQKSGAEELVARYTTGNHTAGMVPLFASGPGAEEFGGMKENREVGRLLMERVSR
jgi:alkaline phosphatase